MFWTRKLDSLDSRNVDAFHIPSDLNLVTSDADRVTSGRASISGARCIPGRSRSGASGLILFDGINISSRDGLNRFGSEFSNLQSTFKTYNVSGSSTKTIRFKWYPGSGSRSHIYFEVCDQLLAGHDHTCIMRAIRQMLIFDIAVAGKWLIYLFDCLQSVVRLKGGVGTLDLELDLDQMTEAWSLEPSLALSHSRFAPTCWHSDSGNCRASAKPCQGLMLAICIRISYFLRGLMIRDS